MLVAQPTERVETLLEQRLCDRPVLSFDSGDAEHVSAVSLAPRVAERVREVARLLGAHLRSRRIGRTHGHDRCAMQRPYPGRGPGPLASEQSLQTITTLEEIPTQVPEAVEGAGELKSLVVSADRFEPVEDGSKVVVVLLEAIQPLLGASLELGEGLLC
jgi:hypothetical protein